MCEFTECASVWARKHTHVQVCLSVRASDLECTSKFVRANVSVKGQAGERRCWQGWGSLSSIFKSKVQIY